VQEISLIKTWTIENWTFLNVQKMSNLNYTKLLKTKKNFFYGNKIFIDWIFCYHKKIFWRILSKSRIFGSNRWLMDG